MSELQRDQQRQVADRITPRLMPAGIVEEDPDNPNKKVWVTFDGDPANKVSVYKTNNFQVVIGESCLVLAQGSRMVAVGLISDYTPDFGGGGGGVVPSLGTADTVYSLVRNSTGGALAKGTVVYTSGANGIHVNVSPALATSDATSARTLGFLTTSLANNEDGYAITSGYLEDVDTSGAPAAGSIVYLSSSTAGQWTYTKPVAPNHLVYLGVVARKNATNGVIYVHPQNGYELDEIHDVLLTSEANGDLLEYESSTGLWKNKANGAVLKSTVTTTGDLIVGNGSASVTRLAAGTSGYVLTANGAGVQPTWQASAGGVPTTRTISTTAPLAGGGDLSANRTLSIADATTAVKGAVQLTDSIISTSTTTAATPNSVRIAYEVGNNAIPASTVTTVGDLLVANGASSLTRLAAGTSTYVLTANGAGVAPTWQAAAGGGYSTVLGRYQAFVENRSSSGTTRTISTNAGIMPSTLAAGDSVTVNIGNASYDGTFTVLTKTSNSFTYTAGSSLTESLTASGGTFGFTKAVTQRSSLVIPTPASSPSDVSSNTQINNPGVLYTTPTSGNLIYPALTGITNSSYSSYQTMKATPIWLLEAGITYSQIRVVASASSNTGTIRFGIYGTSFDYKPRTLVVDFGTTPITGVGSPLNQALSISWTVPQAGLYWLVCCIQTSNAASPSITQGTLQPFTNLMESPSSYEVASTTGAFPTAPSWVAAAAPTLAPAIRLVRS